MPREREQSAEPEGAQRVASSEPLATPHEHAKALGLVKTRSRPARVNGEPPTFEDYSPQHGAASGLHGWLDHEHHANGPIQITLSAYKAALHAAYFPVTRIVDGDRKGTAIDSLEAATNGIPTFTDYEPHAAALSPYCAHSKA